MWPCFVVSSMSSLVSLVAAAAMFLSLISRGMRVNLATLRCCSVCFSRASCQFILLSPCTGLAEYQPDVILISQQHSDDRSQLRWKLSYDVAECGTVTPAINIKTRDFMLWPVGSQSLPISIGADYNVTPPTLNGAAEVNVTLSLLLNEKVLDHVPYVVCILTIRNVYGDTVCERKSDTVSLLPAVTTPARSTTTNTSPGSSYTSSQTATNSASRTHCNNYLSPLLWFCILLCMYMLP